jgi:hypothetical protein
LAGRRDKAYEINPNLIDHIQQTSINIPANPKDKNDYITIKAVTRLAQGSGKYPDRPNTTETSYKGMEADGNLIEKVEKYIKGVEKGGWLNQLNNTFVRNFDPRIKFYLEQKVNEKINEIENTGDKPGHPGTQPDPLYGPSQSGHIS